MAITFDVAATPVFSATASTTLETAAFTIAGSDRCLVVAVLSGAGTPVNPSAVKWGGSGGVSLTQIGSTVDVGANVKVSIWRLAAPATGSSTVHVTWGSAQDERAIVAANYNGVDQTTVNRTAVTATGSGVDPTATVTDTNSQADDWVVDGVGILDLGGLAPLLAVGAGQTSRGEVEGANLTYEALGTSNEPATGANTVMSWAVDSNTGNVSWGIIAASLIPSTGGAVAMMEWKQPTSQPTNHFVPTIVMV